MESLLDIHVHGESMYSRFHIVRKVLKKKASAKAKCWKKAAAEHLLYHIKKDNLDTMYIIYRKPETIMRLQDMNDTDCIIRGMYYIKHPLRPSIKTIIELYQKRLIHAFKLHPVMDYYSIDSSALKAVWSLARNLEIPVLFHTDDRKEFMELTSPDKVENLIKRNPDINFIIGHGGTYAHPRVCGGHPSMRAYWRGKKTPYSRIELIARALATTRTYKNAYYDLTISTNRVKASIIVDFLRHYPETASKILVGSDFPLGMARTQSQVEKLKEMRLPDNLLEKIIKNRPFEKS